MSKNIAIVEDDPDQRENYADALTKQGYNIRTYNNRPDAEAALQANMPDLAILDVMLESEPDGGFDLCRFLRSKDPQLPIIFLTSRDSDIDRVSGLRLDAWDYLTKPITLDYLAVRVASLFRIAETVNKTVAASDEKLLQRGSLSLNEDSMSVTWSGNLVDLTLTEFWIVEALARHAGRVRSYDELMQVTKQTIVEKNTINGHIRRIRNKLKSIDPQFSCINNVFGVGYKWNCE